MGKSLFRLAIQKNLTKLPLFVTKSSCKTFIFGVSVVVVVVVVAVPVEQRGQSLVLAHLRRKMAAEEAARAEAERKAKGIFSVRPAHPTRPVLGKEGGGGGEG